AADDGGRRVSPHAAMHAQARALSSACGEAQGKGGQRTDDAVIPGRALRHAFFLLAFLGFSASAAGAAALLLLFAGGLLCDRLAFSASMRLMTLPPRSGAAAMTGL